MNDRALSLTEQLETRLTGLGYRFKIVPIAHLKDLEEEITSRHTSGALDDLLYHEYLSSFEFQPPESLPNAKSIIIVATPQPILSLIFEWKVGERQVLIPPTYDWSVIADIKQALEEVLSPECYTIASARLPLKLLAMRGGLVQYGRNNIGYVTGLGSFFRLSAFLTDLPCPSDEWLAEPAEMARCPNCTACLVACPTGAIGEDRFLLRAERCLTFHNESLRDFPDYVTPSMHNALVGCLLCQRCCPENSNVKDWIEERERFTREETEQLMSDTPADEFAPETRAKLERLCLLDDLPLVRRNLGLLLN